MLLENNQLNSVSQEVIHDWERFSERMRNATRFFTDFIGLGKDEKVLFLSHIDPQSTDAEFIGILRAALDAEGNAYHEIIADSATRTDEIIQLLDSYPVVWSSCNWDETCIDFYELIEAIEEKNARMEDAAGLTANALNNDGMLGESRDVFHERMKRMQERLKDTVGFHIKSRYGTDLTIALRPHHNRRWAWVTGEVDHGEWDNPGAEIFTTPDERGVNGILMLPVLQDEITREQGVDQFVRLQFHEGKIVTIGGGESAKKLREYLEKASMREDDPESVVQCSELAFGGSVYARSKVLNEHAAYTHPGVSVLEAEKRLGTMHVAIGSAQHGIEGASGPTESNIHVDFVLPRSGLTVTGFWSQDDFKKRQNGQKLINDGSWNFL